MNDLAAKMGNGNVVFFFVFVSPDSSSRKIAGDSR
jgi:hypothetical protein